MGNKRVEQLSGVVCAGIPTPNEMSCTLFSGVGATQVACALQNWCTVGSV